MIRLQVALIFVLFVLFNKLQENIFSGRRMEIVGSLPIEPRKFKAGKLCLVLAWISSLVQAAGLNLRLFPLPYWGELAALALFYLGLLVLVLSYCHLGEANKIGLPQENTVLKTHGLYAVGRNPLYAGLFIILLASTLYTLNPLTALLSVMAVAVYHKVVLAEEDFLLQRFGAQYQDYQGRVRRYFLF